MKEYAPVLEEFHNLISMLCANSSVVRKERDSRLHFTVAVAASARGA